MKKKEKLILKRVTVRGSGYDASLLEGDAIESRIKQNDLNIIKKHTHT